MGAATRPRDTRRSTTIVVAILVLVATACSSDASTSPDGVDTQAVDAETLAERFDAIPKHPLSEPVDEATQGDGVVTRSYTVRGASPQQIATHYERTLADGGWELVPGAEEVGSPSLTVEWVSGPYELRLSTNEMAGLDGEPNPTEGVVTQHSLTLTAS